MNNNLCIQTKNLKKAFDGKEVIKDVAMHVQQGTIYGFLGANGAGKTTVIKLISGLLSPTMGTIQVLGMEVDKHKNEVLRSIGTIISTPVFYNHLSALDNLDIHLKYMGSKAEKVSREENIHDTLKLVGLHDTGVLPVSKFSLGMRQRLAIARAIIHNPKVLLLDEPINGLDPMGIRDMRELFLELVKNRGMTMLISSHILSEIGHIADTVGVIVDGCLVKEVSLLELKKEDVNLENYFLSIMSGRRN